MQIQRFLKTVSKSVPSQLIGRNIPVTSKIFGNLSVDQAKMIKMPEPKIFPSYKEALAYAKDKILQALHKEKPCEYAVIIDKKHNTVVAEYLGDSRNITCNYLHMQVMPKDVRCFHGHPTVYKGEKITTPISLNDLQVLNNRGKEAVAFNANGEFSLLYKMSDFKKLSTDDLKELNKIYLKSIFAKGDQASFHKLLNSSSNPRETEQILEQLIIDTQLSNPKFVDRIHNFWLENAPKINIKYKTNYSYLA